MFFPAPCVLLHGAEAVVVLYQGRVGSPGWWYREGESQEVRGTSQPAWESGHGDWGGEYYTLEDQGNRGRLWNVLYLVWINWKMNKKDKIQGISPFQNRKFVFY